MYLSLTKALQVTLLLSLVSFSVIAQRSGTGMKYRGTRWSSFNPKDYTDAPKFWQRFYIGVNKPMEKAEMIYSYEGRDYYGKMESEYVYEKMRNKGNYGVSFGTIIPLAKINKTSKLCLSAEVMMNMYEWIKEDVDEVSVSYFDIFKTQKTVKALFAGKNDMSMPITIDFRTGCDVMMSKKMPACFAIGFGVNPARKQGFYYSLLGESQITMYPIIKAEFGFRAGVGLKIRAMYEMGKNTYVSYVQSASGTYDESLTLSSNGCFIMSLLIVPTAFSWTKD